MALVKTVLIRMGVIGDDTSKAKLDDLAARAKLLGSADFSIRMSVKDDEAMLKLDALKLELDALRRSGHDLDDVVLRIRAIGEAADSPILKIAALRAELAGLGTPGPGGVQGGFLPGLLQSAPVHFAAIGLAISPLIAELSQILPPITAAGIGVGSFAALAIPTFKTIETSVSQLGVDTKAYDDATTTAAKNTALKKIQADWAALNPQQRQVVRGIEDVKSEFSGLAKVLQPLVLNVMKNALPVISQLIGDMGPFASQAGKAIDGLVKGLGKFVMSPGFKDFLNQMLKLSGPAITTIGQGFGQIAISFGKFLEEVNTPNGLRVLKGILDGIADTVKFLGVAFRDMDDALAATVDFISSGVQHVGHIFNTDIPQYVDDAVHWFSQLPGKVSSALSALPGQMVALGANMMQGLINGLDSMLGRALANIQSLGSQIVGAAKKFFHVNSPSLVFAEIGASLMEGLILGMNDGSGPAVSLASELGFRISDALLKAFEAGGTKGAAAGKTIAGLIRGHLEAIRQYAINIQQSMIGWASLTSALTGTAFTNPAFSAGSTTFSHTAAGVTTGAAGTPPPTGHSILRNMKLDLGRLKAFSGALKKLQRMGLDKNLMAQIIAAGPDQGYQIAEAIIDAGRGDVRQLNRTEGEIGRISGAIGVTGAKSQYRGEVNIYFNHLIAGDPRQIAREIQKLLADLKRHNGGAALGLT